MRFSALFNRVCRNGQVHFSHCSVTDRGLWATVDVASEGRRRCSGSKSLRTACRPRTWSRSSARGRPVSRRIPGVADRKPAGHGATRWFISKGAAIRSLRHRRRRPRAAPLRVATRTPRTQTSTGRGDANEASTARSKLQSRTRIIGRSSARPPPLPVGRRGPLAGRGRCS